MIDKILKMFFVKKSVNDEKITVIKTREMKDFREFRRDLMQNPKTPESQATCLSGYFRHIKGLYDINSNRINSLSDRR